MVGARKILVWVMAVVVIALQGIRRCDGGGGGVGDDGGAAE